MTKRPGEVQSVLTGYALPLEGILDLHAQMDFQFLHGGTRSVRIAGDDPLEVYRSFVGLTYITRVSEGR